MEDLHRAPEENLRKICNWIDLPWDEALLKSTINGKQWWSEKNDLQLSGFNTAFSSESFEEYLSGLDRFRLNILLGRKFAAWEYAVPWWNKNLIAKLLVLPFLVFPFKMEIMAWLSIMEDIRQDKKPVAMRSWLRLRALVGGFGLGRIALFRAWLLIIRGHQKEVQLL